jgi:hypothetical protein
MANEGLIFAGTFFVIAHQTVPMKSRACAASSKRGKKSTSHLARRENFIGKFVNCGEC